jgi:hypothetical protein
MNGEMDYYEIYRKMSPLVEGYLDRYPIYPWQSLDRTEIDRMVNDLYNEIGDNYLDLMGIKGKAETAQFRRGLVRTVLGLILLGSLFRRFPFHPWFGIGSWPGSF